MVGVEIDQNDPLFIGNSDSSSAVLVPIKLVGSENYGIWSRAMRIALLGKRKYGFVTVSEELLSGIVYATNSFSVWNDLKERFDKVNRVRIYQLHRDITTLSQGTDSVSHYFSKLKTQWNEYDAIVPNSI
nr:uncharacterized protein LOC104646503 [Solanum lycopersicum]